MLLGIFFSTSFNSSIKSSIFLEPNENRLQRKLIKLLNDDLIFLSWDKTILILLIQYFRTSSFTFGLIFQFLILEKSLVFLKFSKICFIKVSNCFPKNDFKSNFLKLLFKKLLMNSSVAIFKSINLETSFGPIVSISSFLDSWKKLIISSLMKFLSCFINWIPAS